jgi:adenylate cyclase
VVGVAFIIVIIGAAVAYFIFTGDYFQTLTPLLATVATFIALTIIKFLATAKERTFIRNAFSHYLSTDVINEIMDNPDMLALGGEKKFLTAFFTDVKGFSSISENMDPTDLVRLLNIYLTEMSNIILELHGTIDKYEGDAIISFFGAPINLEDHARRACLSAIRMRRMEKELNRRVLDEKLSPNPLYTRIGINTGEMVVGNMGTAQKMDYTMMGNSVNLASRLEGVNKQYGSWTLMSETTFTEGGREFATRKLDRVRVVGIQEPVRLYELIDEWANISSEERTAIDTFHQALDIFERREWDGAVEQFQKVLDYKPEDGPAQTYIKRCKDFKKKAPPENWDGVFNLSMK